MFLRSEYINLYPSALRGGTATSDPNQQYIKDPESKIGTEFNITSAANNITIDGSFVIDKEIVYADDTHRYLRFCVHGYFFRVNVYPLFSSNEFIDATQIYTTIKLSPLGNSGTAPDDEYKLWTLDAVNGTTRILDVNISPSGSEPIWEFRGIDFSTSKSTATNTYSLLILDRDNASSDWRVPPTSILKLDSSTVAIKEDAGSIAPTPLHDILYKNTSGNINLEVDEGHFKDVFTTTIVADMGAFDEIWSSNDGEEAVLSINSNGVAQKSSMITDNQGNAAAAGSDKHPVYVNAQGKIVAVNNLIENSITGNAATATEAAHAELSSKSNILVNSNETAYSVGDANTAVYFKNGIPVAGMKIHVSQSAPTASDPGNNGDIWFQYS